MTRFIMSVALAFAFAAPAAADEFRPSSSIQSVVVFPVGASVTRTVPVQLPAGESVVVLDDLPAEIETDSVTIEGSADSGLEIGSVGTRILPADPRRDPARREILDEIRTLEDQRAEIADRIGALDGRRRFVEEMLKAVPEGFAKSLGEGAGEMDRWSAASTALGADLDAIATARRALQREDRTLAERVEERSKALDQLPPPRNRLEVKIELVTEAPAKGVLFVGYRAPSASWAPSYHALLTTGASDEKPALQVIWRAEVSQATGEDWSQVALTLSTARPAGGTAAPHLEALLATLEQRFAGSDGYGRHDKLAVPPAPTARALGMAESAQDHARVRPAIPIEAIADFGDFRAEYRVPGTVSLASGIGARAFRISTESAEPELEVRAVPLLSSSAYLTARFTAPSSAPLLAGKVSLFRDGAFVGQGTIPFVNGGTDVDLGFGVDDRVKVTRVAIDRAVTETGILTSRRSDMQRFRITVENLHVRPMKITVLDRIPYSEDEKIVIAKLGEMTAPTAEDVDDRRGVFSWSYLYEPGESRTIQNAYRVTWPAGENVVLAD